MKFTISQTTLANALNVVGKGIASSPTIPILSGIYIKAADGTVEFQTTNLNVSIKHRAAANIEEEGTTVISGRLLSNIVKNLPDEAVTITTEERVVGLTCGASSYQLNSLDPGDFPEFPQYKVDKSVELPVSLLSEMVDKVYKVTSSDTSRPTLSGVLMTVEENTLRLVATDSYRLAVCDTNTETSSLSGSFETLVPGSVFHDVLSIPADEESIYIGSTESQIVFLFGNTTYVTRKIEGNYPNYKQLLPSGCACTVKLNVKEFTAALRRVSVVATNTLSVRFDMDTDAGVVVMHSSSVDQGEATESVAAEISGEDMSIALNYHYVFDCINAVSDAEDITLELQSSMQPGIFKSNGKVNYLYLLMPVRM